MDYVVSTTPTSGIGAVSQTIQATGDADAIAQVEARFGARIAAGDQVVLATPLGRVVQRWN